MSLTGIIKTVQAVAGAISKFMGFLRDRRLIRAGRDSEKVKTQDKVLKNVKKAKIAKSNLNDDGDRVRDKFTRD